jgi:CRISPR-associated protein Cas1
MSKSMSSDTATKYMMGQYDVFRNPQKVQYLQNQIVKAKLESQIHFLKSLDKVSSERTDAIAKYQSLVEGNRSKRELLTIESRASNLYFRTCTVLFDKKYGFDSRRGGGINMSNRYAADVINGLLNYAYSVLAGEIAKFVNGLGLDSYYGFYHSADTSFQALVYDLIEPFRWMAERAVYEIASETKHNYPIKKEQVHMD